MKITRKQLFSEIDRAGKAAKLSDNAITAIKNSVTDKSRVSVYSYKTSNNVKHPLVLAGIIDPDNYELLDNPFVKSGDKVNVFTEEFSPGGLSRERNRFVNVS